MNVAKMVEYISKNGSIAKSKDEKRDCAVRALSAAFDIAYDDAHEFARLQWKRKRGYGTHTSSIVQTLNNASYPDTRLSLFGKKTKLAKVVNEYKVLKGVNKGTTYCKSKLGTFAKKNNSGTYYVLVKGHATVIKDGIVLDNSAPGSIVKYAWKINDIE